MTVEVPEIGLALREYRGSTCWQMYEWATGRKDKEGNALPDDWRPMEKYPATLEHGLKMMFELAARKSDVRCTLESALNELRRIETAIVEAMSDE